MKEMKGRRQSLNLRSILSPFFILLELHNETIFQSSRVVLIEQADQLEVCLPCSKLLTGKPILSVFQNLRWNNIKITLSNRYNMLCLV